MFEFPDLPDYLKDQGDRWESIQEEVGAVEDQHVPVLRNIRLAVKVVF